MDVNQDPYKDIRDEIVVRCSELYNVKVNQVL